MTKTQIAQIAEIVALVLSQQAGKMPKHHTVKKIAKAMPKASKPVTDRKADFAAKVVSTFTKAGFAKVEPNVTVLTYKRWTEKGLQPKAGSKAIKVDGVPLFHRSQCELIEPIV